VLLPQDLDGQAGLAAMAPDPAPRCSLTDSFLSL
jgi:hypothetical protein